MNSIGSKEEKDLRQKVFRVQLEVDAALGKLFGKRLWKLTRKEDQLRLLTLKIWSEKYDVSVEEVIKILVEHYQTVQYKKMHRQPVFGTALVTLVGQHSERVLQEKLKKLYPDREPEINAQQKEREQQLELLRKKGGRVADTSLDFTDLNKFMKEYRNTVKQSQEQTSSLKVLTRRRYRKNPW